VRRERLLVSHSGGYSTIRHSDFAGRFDNPFFTVTQARAMAQLIRELFTSCARRDFDQSNLNSLACILVFLSQPFVLGKRFATLWAILMIKDKDPSAAAHALAVSNFNVFVQRK
jgi:hypothetical protein